MSWNHNTPPHTIQGCSSPSKSPIAFGFGVPNSNQQQFPCPNLSQNSNVYQSPMGYSLDRLPRCLLKFTMSFLTKRSLLSMRAVCRRFNSFVFESATFEQVDLKAFSNSSEEHLVEFVQRIPYRQYVKSLVLPRFMMSPRGISALFHLFGNLEQLQGDQACFGDSQMVAFNAENSVNVRSLILNATQVTDCGLSVLSCWQGFNRLEKLVISNHRCSGMTADGVIGLIANNPNLRTFVVANCFLDCSKLLPAIANNLHKLEHLCLCGITHITPSSLEWLLQSCPNLKKLSMKVSEQDHSNAEHSGVVTVQHQNLESLGLSCLRNVHCLQIECPRLKELFLVQVTLMSTFAFRTPRLESLELCLASLGVPPPNIYPPSANVFELCPLNNILAQVGSVKRLKMIMCQLMPQLSLSSCSLERLDLVKCEHVQQLELLTPELTYFRAEQCPKLNDVITNDAPLIQHCLVTEQNRIMQCVKCMKVVNTFLDKRGAVHH